MTWCVLVLEYMPVLGTPWLLEFRLPSFTRRMCYEWAVNYKHSIRDMPGWLELNSCSQLIFKSKTSAVDWSLCTIHHSTLQLHCRRCHCCQLLLWTTIDTSTSVFTEVFTFYYVGSILSTTEMWWFLMRGRSRRAREIFLLSHIAYLHLCVTATSLSSCDSHPRGVHTDSIAAATLLLPASSFYIDFAFDNGHQ